MPSRTASVYASFSSNDTMTLLPLMNGVMRSVSSDRSGDATSSRRTSAPGAEIRKSARMKSVPNHDGHRAAPEREMLGAQRQPMLAGAAPPLEPPDFPADADAVRDEPER